MKQIMRYLIVGVITGLAFWGCATMPDSTVEPVEEFYFFPPPPDEPRIQFLKSITYEQDFVKPPKTFLDFIAGIEVSNKGEVVKPYGVAIHDGIIYVCDTAKNVIDVLNLKEGRFGHIGVKSALKFRKPINIAVEPDGTKYITDTYLQKVLILDEKNRFVKAFESEDSMKPTDIAIYRDKAFVVDIAGSRIVVFDKRSGKSLYAIGERGNEPGQMADPTNIAVDQQGNLYVSDTGGYRIQKFSREGKPLMIYGQGIGDAIGQFSRPKGVAVDREGRLYSVDARHMVVQVFDAEGRILMYFGGMGGDPGHLSLPAQVTIDYDNVAYFNRYAAPDFEIEYLIIVTSQFGFRRVNIFGFGHKKKGEANAG